MLAIKGVIAIIDTDVAIGVPFTTMQATILLCAGVAIATAGDFIPNYEPIKYQMIAWKESV